MIRRTSSDATPDRRALPDRILVVAESDSYLKWAAHLVGRLDVTDVDVLVLDGPSTPSERQRRLAVEGTRLEGATIRTTSVFDVRRQVRSERFGSVLLACTGPTVALLTVAVGRRTKPPVTICGIPGVALPTSERAVITRSRCDVHVVHSLTEREVFSDRYRATGGRPSVRLASLPMLSHGATDSTGRSPDRRVVFAPQPSVPSLESERRRLIELLAASSEDPVVVKLRATDSERTTHKEAHSYPRLITDLNLEDRFEYSYRSMADELGEARCLVTVSSTAALEAIDRHVPVVIVGDFGVRPELLNEVFVGSGLIQRVDASSLAANRTPDGPWSERHYFHDPTLNDATGDPRDWRRPLEMEFHARVRMRFWFEVVWSATRVSLFRPRTRTAP